MSDSDFKVKTRTLGAFVRTSFVDGAESWCNWSESWERPMKFKGSQISEDELTNRVKEVISQWRTPLPSDWMRENFGYIKAQGYRRGDKGRSKSEHLLEERLFAKPTWMVTGLSEVATFVPVLNAISLANTNEKQREIDVLGIINVSNRRIPCSVEMKGATTNHAWHAVVENLQHLRLLHNHPSDFLSKESPDSACYQFKNLPLSEAWGAVLAPSSFFHKTGKKENSFRYAKKLVKSIKQEIGVTILLACFPDDSEKPIKVLS